MAWLFFLICLETALSAAMNLRHAVYLGKSRTRLPGVLHSELAQVKGKDEPNPDCPFLRRTASTHNLTLHPSVAKRNPEESGWQQFELLEGCQTAAGSPAIPSSGRWEVSLATITFILQKPKPHCTYPASAQSFTPFTFSQDVLPPIFFILATALSKYSVAKIFIIYNIFKTQLPSLFTEFIFPGDIWRSPSKRNGLEGRVKNTGTCMCPQGPAPAPHSRPLAVTIPHPRRPRAVFSVAGCNDPSTVPGAPRCFF